MKLKVEAIKTRINEFLSTNQNSFVVQNGLAVFKLTLNNVVNSVTFQDSNQFFNDQTSRSKILFKEFLKKAEVVQLIGQLNILINYMIKISKEILTNLDAIIENANDMDNTLKENHCNNLKVRLLNDNISIKELKSSHVYLSSRLEKNRLEEIIKLTKDFHIEMRQIKSNLDKLLS